MAEPGETLQAAMANVTEVLAKVRIENSILKADVGFWKKQHERAVEREDALKKELRDKNARIAYLTRQLYERKTEQKKAEAKTSQPSAGPGHRVRGQQPDRPIPKRRNRDHLPIEEEPYDLSESEKFCATCGLPFVEMPDTEDSELIETLEVSRYRRRIHRKKYRAGCRCPGNTGIITAPGPATLIPQSPYGASIWIQSWCARTGSRFRSRGSSRT